MRLVFGTNFTLRVLSRRRLTRCSIDSQRRANLFRNLQVAGNQRLIQQSLNAGDVSAAKVSGKASWFLGQRNHHSQRTSLVPVNPRIASGPTAACRRLDRSRGRPTDPDTHVVRVPA